VNENGEDIIMSTIMITLVKTRMEYKPENVISCGYGHTAVVTSEGKVRCWGFNRGRQCEPPVELENVVAVSAGLNTLLHSLYRARWYAGGQMGKGNAMCLKA
jgi:alpha-tubulin suppressor-like RCC1 family protein